MKNITKIVIKEKIDRNNNDIQYKKNIIESIGNSAICQRNYKIAMWVRIIYLFYNLALIGLFSFIIVKLDQIKNSNFEYLIYASPVLILPFSVISGYAYLSYPASLPSTSFKRSTWTNRVTRIFLLSRYTQKNDEDIEYLFKKYLFLDHDLEVIENQEVISSKECKKTFNFKTLKLWLFVEEIIINLSLVIVFALIVTSIILLINMF